jgi:hypothetical protein
MDLTKTKSADLKAPDRISDISDLVPEGQKSQDKYLKANIDYAIASLVHTRPELDKAWAFYNGERDAREFQYLTENFGIGTPSDLNFTPLIRSHIKTLVGILATTTLDYRATCTDEDSLDVINRDRAKAVKEEVMRFQMQAINQLFQQVGQFGKEAQASGDLIREKDLQRLFSYFENDWQHELEIAAQDVAEDHVQNSDMKLALAEMGEDVFVTGGMFYRVLNAGPGTKLTFQARQHRQLYYQKSRTTRFINRCKRVVYVDHMTTTEIINRWGHEMSQSDLDRLVAGRSENLTSARIAHSSLIEHMDARWSGRNFSYQEDVWEVCHVEWVANNKVEGDDGKKRYRLDRYEGYRIGGEGAAIYVGMGKCENVVRSAQEPWKCYLSYNGVVYDDHDGKPFSMVLKTKPLQDRYDILFYHLDNAIARAGGKGVRVHADSIPLSFGNTVEERIMKFVAYTKNGVEVVMGAQGGNPQFAHYGTYDTSLSRESVEGILLAIAKVEESAENITGVNKPMLGQISERAGLGTTNIAMAQSALSTKLCFLLISELFRHGITDMVNESRLAYANGKRGTYLLGDGRKRIFTIDGKKFKLSDYGMYLKDDGRDAEKLDNLKDLSVKLVEGGLVDAEIAIDMVLMDSLSKGKREMKAALRKAKAEQENNSQQEIQQLQQQLQEASQQLKMLEQKAGQVEEQRLQLDQTRVQTEDFYKRSLVRQGDEKLATEVGMEEERIQLEREELLLQTSEQKNEISNKPKTK